MAHSDPGFPHEGPEITGIQEVLTLMSGRIQIRKAKKSDVETLAYFNTLMAWETEGKKLSQPVVTAGVENLLSQPEYGFYLLAEIEGEVAGALMLTSEWSDWRNGLFWWIQSVYVRPEYRRQGVFKSLYQHAERLARQQPAVCGLRLYVDRQNHAAQRTYQSMGMEATNYDLYEIEF